MPEDRENSSQMVFHLEVAQAGDRMKISACEQLLGESGTVRHYEEIPVPMDTISIRCRETAETLNKANRKGCVSRDILAKLRDIGQVFFDDLFTHGIKDKIRKSTAAYLTLNLDDTLVHIPWELLHDGKQFLCQRFSMGRLIRTRQNLLGGGKGRKLSKPLKMLILADPGGDLNGAYSEGVQLRDYMDREKEAVKVSLRTDNITSDYVREKIRNFDFAHYAGHADYDSENPGESGWRLTKGRFRADEIVKMAGTRAMPSLIFSNACQSARTDMWNISESFHDEIFGLANAFVLSGVKHYVGTFWEILDDPSRRFALEFYRHLLAGASVGEAVRQARLTLIREYGEETIVWASYLLYGDPTFNYMERIERDEKPPTHASPLPHETGGDSHGVSVHSPGTKIRAQEDVIDFSEPRRRERKPGPWLSLAAALFLIVAMLLWGYPGFLKTDIAEYRASALAAYHSGDFEAALKACDVLENEDPQVRATYLIRGDICLKAGKLDAAEAEYRQATQVAEGTHQEKARAFMGLGRIASVRKLTDTALAYYQQASEAEPDKEAAYLSRAMLMNESGNHQQALELLQVVRKLSPENQLAEFLGNEIRKKILLSQDQGKQARVNALVRELLENRASPPPDSEPSDKWTSRPLTLWIMDFQTQGIAMHEGEAHLLASGISDTLIQNGRVRLVERAILDRLLEELKMGTSPLADTGAALSLGRLLAARLILAGQILHSGPQTQVSMRLIETETGLISAAIRESFGSAVPPDVLADKLSEHLLEQLRKRYPLRGIVSAVETEQVQLNIGEKAGVTKGQKFRVIRENVTLEIVSTSPDTCLAKVAEGENMPAKGQLAEAF